MIDLTHCYTIIKRIGRSPNGSDGFEIMQTVEPDSKRKENSCCA
jgi:hypothetical protein